MPGLSRNRTSPFGATSPVTASGVCKTEPNPKPSGTARQSQSNQEAGSRDFEFPYQRADSTAKRNTHPTTAARKSRMAYINATRGNVKAVMPRRLRASFHLLANGRSSLSASMILETAYDSRYFLSMLTVADLQLPDKSHNRTSPVPGLQVSDHGVCRALAANL